MSDAQNPPKSETSAESAGLAGSLTRAFLHNPLTPLLLVGFLMLGLVGLVATPRQEDPQISVPMADIFVRYPGASAEQVANQISVPLEQIMMEIKGVKHVYTASMRDQAMVTVQFKVGEDYEESLVKLYDKLASNLDRMPPGASEPLVKPKSVDDVPIVTVTLWSEEVDDASLRLLALEVLKQIKKVPNTSQGFIVSGRRDQMTVSLYPEKLAGHGVTLDQVAQTIRAANSERNAGDMEVGGVVSTIYSGGFLRSARDLQRLVVGMHDGSPVYLRDVADVHRGPNEASSLVSYYTGAAFEEIHDGEDEHVPDVAGAPAVTIAIAKKKGSNGVAVAEDVLNLIDSLKGRVIPDNVHVSITRNYGETAREKVNELIFKLFVATGAVVILVWFFLGWRAAAVVAVVVPIVITFTVFMALVLGFTIDRVSLFALIFSIGILVDDAIVVVENIYRRWLEEEKVSDNITIDAVAEVGNPTILATFTVVAALLPMAAVRGMMGPYMAPIPVLGSVAMVFSLFAAFVFTPWLANKWRPSMAALQEAEEKEHRQAEFLGRLYNATIRRMVENRNLGRLFLASLFIIFFLCMSLFYFKAVRVKMLPLDNKPEFNVVVNFPEGTALAETANLVGQIADKVRQIKEVTAVQTYVGTASPYNFNGLVRHYYLRKKPWEADVQIQLIDKSERKVTSHELAVQVRKLIKPLAEKAGARVQVVEMPPGPPVLQSVVAEVHGPDGDTRRKVARDLEKLFEKAEHLDDVDTLIADKDEIWTFHINREKAQRAGVNVDSINRTLEMAMGGFQLGDIKFNSVLDITPIIMEVPLASRGDLGRIGQLPVPTQMGTTVPLSELGEFVKSDQDPIIYHKDLRSVEYVTAETVGDLAAPIYGMMEVGDLLEGYRAPDGVALSGEMIGPPDDDFKSGFEWTGEWTVTYETFRDMGIAFGVALVLIYMLVVWEFGNFVLPAIVMAPIPLTLVGIVPGHWLLNAEFTATSMIGFIALAGIIVRNSILLVDFSKHQIERGMPVLDALVHACQVRTRPIVITALALVGGSSVILFDPIFQGMAVSLLFGVLVSTALTLFIIPLGCYSARSAFKTLSQAAPADGAGGEGQAGDPTVAGAGNDSKKSGALMSKVSAVFGLLGMLLLDIFKSAFAALWGFAASGAKALLNRFKARPRRVASVDEPQGAASEDRDQRVSDERPMAEALSAIEKEIVSHDIPASASEPPSASGASDGKAVDRETGDGGPDLDTPIAESPVAVEAASRNDEKAVVVAADQDAFPTDSGEAISTPDEAQPRPGSEREKPLVEKSDDDANADVVVAVPPKAPIEETESDPPVKAVTSTAKPRAPKKQARAKVAKTAATKKKSSVKKKAVTKKSAVSRKKKVTPIDEARSGEKARESSAAQEKSAASAPPKTRKKGRRGIRLKGM